MWWFIFCRLQGDPLDKVVCRSRRPGTTDGSDSEDNKIVDKVDMIEQSSQSEVTYRDNIYVLDLTRVPRHLQPYLPRPWPSIRLWIVKDISGIVAALATWFFICFGETSFYVAVLSQFSYLHPVEAAVNGALSLFWAFLGVVAHWRAMFTDPVSGSRDHFVYAHSQWEATLQYNVVSHWLSAFTKWSLWEWGVDHGEGHGAWGQREATHCGALFQCTINPLV